MADDPEKDIKEMKEKLKEKDENINNYLDRIEFLEDNIMKLESLIDDAEEEGGSFDAEKVQETKLAIELADREKKIRALKDKMGFLRKENIQFRKRIEELEKESDDKSSQITPESKEAASMDTLIKELQSKINKQKQMINQLKKEGGAYASSSKYEQQLKEKDQKIKDLKAKIDDLSEKESTDKITKSLTEELQTKLNRARRKMKSLQEELEKYKSSGVEEQDIAESADTTELENQNENLQEQLEEKNTQIQELKERISNLQQAASEESKETAPPKEAPRAISDLTKELQNKLNRRKKKIKQLEAEITELKEDAASSSKEGEQISKLKEQLKEKDEKITQLENQISEREKSIKEADVSKLDELRISELKRMIKELEKVKNQQQAEIYELKK